MSSLPKLVVMGGNGGGQIAISIAEELNKIKPTWEIAGFLNDGTDIGGLIGKYPVVGRTDEAPDFAQKGYQLVFALHNQKMGPARAERVKKMGLPLDIFPNLIHPLAYTGMAESIGHGVLIAPLANCSFGAQIGNFCHVYGGGFVGHDAHMEDFSVVAANAVLGANVLVCESAHIGTNATLREKVRIGYRALVGSGAVVLNDVPDGKIAVGNPAKIIGDSEKYRQ